MLKLLRANFSRLWKTRAFWAAAAVSAMAGAGIPIKYFLDNRAEGSACTPDTACFVCAVLAPILLSVLIPLFLGSDYSDGTLRNKRVAGHTRGRIYLANLITCAAAGAMLCAAYLAFYLALALPLLGGFDAPPEAVLGFAVLTVALAAVYASIFTLIAMLWQSRAHSTAACILAVFALLFWGVQITSALSEPEFYSAYSFTENGMSTEAPEERNPNYLSGQKRRFYEFLKDFTPGGQALQLANMTAEQPARLMLYDGAIAALATGCGLLALGRRDLK